MKDGFHHVEAWTEVAGFWIRNELTLEYARAELYLDPPLAVINPALRPTALRVQRRVKLNRIRDLFSVGPVTCVEQVKAFVGYRNTFVRTPYQLYKALRVAQET